MYKSLDENSIRKAYHQLTKQFIEKKLTISTMESATSGQIASLITDTEGASSIFFGSFITYSNESKIQQGVPADIIETYGVYSKETARAMAKVCRESFATDIGIGITGTMGNPDPANPGDSIPGKVFFSIDFRGKVTDCCHNLPLLPSRFAYKMAVAKEIADVLFTLIAD